MSLADERAATRAGIAAARASTLRRDLNSLETQRRQVQTLNTLERRGARPPTKGRGNWSPSVAGTGTGGGVASPLTEPNVNDRTWWPFGLASSDGLIVLPAIKELKLQDANDAAVVVQLADPAGVTP